MVGGIDSFERLFIDTWEWDGSDAGHGHLALPGIDGPFLLTAGAAPLLLRIGANGSAPLILHVPVDAGLADQFVFFQGVPLPPSPASPSLTGLGDLRIR
jgi:hypothetical protein